MATTLRKKQAAKPAQPVQAANTAAMPTQMAQETVPSLDWGTLPLTPLQAKDYAFTYNLAEKLKEQINKCIEVGEVGRAKPLQDALDQYNSRLAAYDLQVKQVRDCQKLASSLTKGESMLNSLAALLGL